MKIMLATLCLNEMEWLPKLVEQHHNWPDLVNWTFVEAADCAYAAVNKDMVSRRGLSVDGTTDFLAKLCSTRDGFYHEPVGLVGHTDVAQGKCEARNTYLDHAEKVKPDWIVVLDADEFYSLDDQRHINAQLAALRVQSVLYRQRHVWRPPSIMGQDLLQYEVMGAYWSVPHIRVWRWRPGIRYTKNHNHPETPRGISLAANTRRLISPHNPQCVHTGFASLMTSRMAKHRYYKARGEGPKDGRQMYVACREAWESWLPGDALPAGAQIFPYSGPRPEALCE